MASSDTLTSQDWEILTQCLTAAIEGPFLRGIFWGESEIPSLVGPDWDQLHCILRYWPDLDSPGLHAEYDELDKKYEKYQRKNADGSLYPIAPTGSRIYGAVSHCLYLLINGMYKAFRVEESQQDVLIRVKQYELNEEQLAQLLAGQQKQRELYAHAIEIWPQYVSVTHEKAYEVYLLWEDIYHPRKKNESSN